MTTLPPTDPAAAGSIEIQVNGERQVVARGIDVAALLTHLGINSDRVGVERNKVLVRRVAHASTPVLAGDVFEIVSFVGGG